MSDQPLTLTDDDFSDDAPPGYLSHQDKEKYVPWMATLLGGTFVLQLTVPAVLMMITMPMMAFRGMSAGMPQYTKMAAWQDALWYPTAEGPGGGRGGCKLTPLDYRGEPVETPAIELDMHPEWLIADGEKLWAVSKNEVAEIDADGTRPIVMHPTRFLQHASRPFLYQGKLAVVDRDETGPSAAFLFENGEWQLLEELAVPADPRIVPRVSPSPIAPLNIQDVDTPADALHPEGMTTSEDLLASGVAQPIPASSLEVVQSAGIYHVIVDHHGSFSHHVGLPFKGADVSETGPETWLSLDVKATSCAMTTVDDTPAIMAQSNDRWNTQLWRYVDRQWNMTAQIDSLGGGRGTELHAFTTPDGSRTFAVIEAMNGLSEELLELNPNAITKVKSLQGPMPAFMNPLSGNYLWNQFLVQIPTQILMLVMILGSTWLMHKHRVPLYYRGRLSVAYASILRRAFAVGIDALIFWGPVWLGWYLWAVKTDLSYAKFFRTLDAGPAAMWTFFLELLPGLIATACWVLFSLFTEWLLVGFFGCTVGKFVCGVRVARTNLQRPGLLRSLIRILVGVMESTFGAIIPVALIAFLQDRQRLSDLVAGTVVVKAGSLREARATLAMDGNADR